MADQRRNRFTERKPEEVRVVKRETPAPTTSMSKAKYVTYEGLKFMLYVGVIVVSMVVFVLSSQAAQDEAITKTCSDIERIELRYDEHAVNASRAFDKIDRTLVSQQQVLTQTREALIRLDESNKRIVDEVKKLSDQVSP